MRGVRSSWLTLANIGDSGGLKLIHFGGLKLIRPYVQCPPV
jgi:hypothetical protein